MRNLVDHYKGKIYEAVRKSPGENMNWEKTVKALTTFPPQTIGYTTLLREEANPHWRIFRRTEIRTVTAELFCLREHIDT